MYVRKVGRDSAVGIATRYSLDSPWIESLSERIFARSRPTLGPTQPSVQWVPFLFPLPKTAEA